jgi:hypothetical protein
MKVKIGPYLDWWGPYQIFGLLTKIGFSEETTERWAEKSPDWFINVCQWIYNKRHRTIKIKLDDFDVWNMDGTLAIIILPMLKQLKATKHGSPHLPVFDQTSNSAQGCFDFYEVGDELAWDTGHAQWQVIMDEMIWAFEQIQPDCDWEAQYTFESDEIDDTFGWKKATYDWEGMRAHQDRITAAIEMFGKYYQSLWD